MKFSVLGKLAMDKSLNTLGIKDFLVEKEKRIKVKQFFEYLGCNKKFDVNFFI